MKQPWFLLLLPVVAFAAAASYAGREGAPSFRGQDGAVRSSEFSFARVQYDSIGGYTEAYYFYEGRMWQRWETDYPQADENFMFRLRELTTIVPNLESVTRRLTDDDIYQFPFLYMCDVGWMDLSPFEIRELRRYLLKGGFLWVDDFWGWGEWRNFERIMEAVFPQKRWQDIPPGHPILSTVYQLDSCPQIPARDFAVQGWKHDPPDIHRLPAYGIEDVHLRGYFDDDGRLMAIATHNTDIGDGWEREGYGEWYFETYSTLSYAMGVNIIAYALSH